MASVLASCGESAGSASAAGGAKASGVEGETAPAALPATISNAIAEDHAYVAALYKDLHRSPELSLKEADTSARLASELEAIGFTVTRGVGSAWTKEKATAEAGEEIAGVDGYGVVGIFENGDGPTILIRTDMDALPLAERTNVDYASKATGVSYLGKESPVMHACGHDVHMASWVGVARRLTDAKDAWSGTLIMAAQPAEEISYGALAMINDGLFQRFPRPDYNLALHVTGVAPAGSVAFAPGYAMAAVDSVDIYVQGVGGHGAYPHLAKDPIVIASRIVGAIQTLVSREVNPLKEGVVTVGAFNAGYKHNVIPEEAHLQITVRSYDESVREILIEGIKRIARAQGLSAGMPEDKLPVVTVKEPGLVSLYNDPELAEVATAAISAELGAGKVYAKDPVMGGEDFAYFGKTDEDVPSFLFWLGGADADAFARFKAGEGPAPASIHSPFFAPPVEPTLKTGVRAMTAAAIDLFNNERLDDAVREASRGDLPIKTAERVFEEEVDG